MTSLIAYSILTNLHYTSNTLYNLLDFPITSAYNRYIITYYTMCKHSDLTIIEYTFILLVKFFYYFANVFFVKIIEGGFRSPDPHL